MAHYIEGPVWPIQMRLEEQLRSCFDQWGTFHHDRGCHASVEVVNLICNCVKVRGEDPGIPIVGTTCRLFVRDRSLIQPCNGRQLLHQPETFGSHPKLMTTLAWSLHSWLESGTEYELRWPKGQTFSIPWPKARREV